MKLALVAFSLTLFLIHPTQLHALTEQETMAVLNSVNQRIANKDITALDDVKALATNDAVAGFLMFFRQNHYTFKGPAWQHEIANKAALMATEVPGAEEYFRKLFRKTSPVTGHLVRQREVAVDCLLLIHSKLCVRVFMEAMLDPELDTRMNTLGLKLAKMDLAEAPFSSSEVKGSAAPAGIEKWKVWWNAHKQEYAP